MMISEAIRSVMGLAAVAELQTLTVGERLLDRYEIRRFVARGGMGEVYEAEDEVLHERVALKTLLPTALDDGDAIDRLLAEVRLARKVTHPNVCRMLEFGLYQRRGTTPLPFLTMELLNGEPLSRRIARRGPLSSAEVRKALVDVAAGLSAIHACGIVHRDFKSANVFIVADGDGDERAVVMDFGLARRRDDLIRRSGPSGGTPDYMAPEQVEGKAATPAFDIYALGVVLFEMLTGRTPFAGTTAYLTAVSRLHQRAPTPSQLVPDLPPAWDLVVGRCLERDPARRFASVADIVPALDAASRGERGRGRRWLVGAVAAGVAVLAMAALVLQRRPPHPPAVTADLSPPTLTVPLPRAPAASLPTSATAQPRVPARAVRPAGARSRPRRSPSIPAPDNLRQAEALMLDGAVVQACALGEQAATGTPAAAGPHRFLGKCYTRLGQPDRAARHYRRYLELAPDAPDRVFVRAIVGETH
jgi:tRNA A-37 threonylcarbamoyl transferase component Bud32